MANRIFALSYLNGWSEPIQLDRPVAVRVSGQTKYEFRTSTYSTPSTAILHIWSILFATVLFWYVDLRQGSPSELSQRATGTAVPLADGPAPL